MVKDMDFKIGRANFQGQSRHKPLQTSRNGAWLGLGDPKNFWALNANNSKTVKAADFKFYIKPFKVFLFALIFNFKLLHVLAASSTVTKFMYMWIYYGMKT